MAFLVLVICILLAIITILSLYIYCKKSSDYKAVSQIEENKLTSTENESKRFLAKPKSCPIAVV